MSTVRMAITPVTAVDIDEEIAAKMAASLATYTEMKIQRDLLDEAMKKESKQLLGEMELLGVDKLEVEGYPCTIVRGETTSLDELKFVQLGGDLELLNRAKVTKPKQPYLLVGKKR